MILMLWFLDDFLFLLDDFCIKDIVVFCFFLMLYVFDFEVFWESISGVDVGCEGDDVIW